MSPRAIAEADLLELPTPKMFPANNLNAISHYWRQAFDWYNRHLNEKEYDLSLSCRPCYKRVYDALLEAKNQKLKKMEENTAVEMTEPQTRDFGQALTGLKNGYKLARDGWNGKGMWIHLQTPTDQSKMTLPYIYMKTADDKLVPWLASQTDILAEDWTVVE